MTSNAWQVYDVFYESLGAQLHDLDGVDTIKCALLDSGYTPDTAVDVTFATIDADELATAFGYTAGGAVTVATWDAAAGVLTLDVADITWTASGGSITARYAVLYNSSAGGTNDLIAYCLLDNTPADVTATDGNDFKIVPSVSGVFTIAQ